MNAQKPDVEIRRKVGGGYRSLIIIYWKPLWVWILGKRIIDMRTKHQLKVVEAIATRHALERREEETLRRVHREIIRNGSHSRSSILHWLAMEIGKFTNEVQDRPVESNKTDGVS